MTSHEMTTSLRAAEQGIAWIRKQQREDGSFCDVEDGIGAYYKIPFALSLAGFPRAGQRLLDWVAIHHFTQAGDFKGPRQKATESVHESWPVYGNSWLILGAHRLGRLDLSLRGIEYVLGFQNEVGGFYVFSGENRYFEPVCTSWGGFAALVTGHLPQARLAGDWFINLVEDQPDPARFYFRTTVEGGLDTDVPHGSELFYFVDSARRKQIYFNLGIGLIFLMHLYRATGDDRYLHCGQKIFAFSQQCAADVYSFPPSGKLGLGCALLYSLTGSSAARQAAVELCDYLVRVQTPDGFWILPDEELYSAIQSKESLEVKLDITAEFSVFLAEIGSYL
jgi:hypothetical protein